MKLKEIKPDMVIHCPTEEDAMALLEHLGKDYDLNRQVPFADMCYFVGGSGQYYRITSNKREDYEKCGYYITEFSDLIIDDSHINSDTDSPMSREEILQWLFEHYDDDEYIKAFGEDYSFRDLGEKYKDNIGEAIKKIEQYEAAKKAPKTVEVEVGYWYKVYASDTGTIAEGRMWNCTWNEADLRARKIAYDYTKEHGCECCTEIRYICHAKEGES